MTTLVCRFCAVLAVFGCGCTLARAAGPVAPPPPAPAAEAPPVEVPGPPPLPPAGTDVGHLEPEAASWGSFFADGEFLYLKPYRRDLDFAILSPNANGDPEGSIQSDAWHSRAAFRIGAGWQAPNNGPDVGFYYTYLHDDQVAGLTAPPGGLLFATLTHPGSVAVVTSATADARLAYNVFDLEVSRRLGACDSVSVRPFGGLRFAEITQDLNAAYNGGDANRDTVSSHSKFDGGGLRAGAEVDWMLLDRVSLYGRAAGSLMVGDFQNTQTEFNNDGRTPLTNVNESFRKIIPVAELGFGVAYQGEHFRLSVGYEVVNWFNLIDTPDFVDDVHQGKLQRRVSDLGLDGLAVKAEFVY